MTLQRCRGLSEGFNRCCQPVWRCTDPPGTFSVRGCLFGGKDLCLGLGLSKVTALATWDALCGLRLAEVTLRMACGELFRVLQNVCCMMECD